MANRTFVRTFQRISRFVSLSEKWCGRLTATDTRIVQANKRWGAKKNTIHTPSNNNKRYMRANHSIFPWIIWKAIKNRLFFMFLLLSQTFRFTWNQKVFGDSLCERVYACDLIDWLITLLHFFYSHYTLFQHCKY